MDVIKSHKNLAVWHQALALASKVYAATRKLPSDERDGLVLELRSASLAVVSGIAAGSAGNSGPERLKRLHAARDSLSQLEAQLLIAVDLGLLSGEQCAAPQIAEIEQALHALLHGSSTLRTAAHARACAPLRNR